MHALTSNNNHWQYLRRVHAVRYAVQKSCGEKERLNLQRVQQQQQQRRQERRRQEDLQLHQSCSAKIENLEATVKQQRQVKLLALASTSICFTAEISCVRFYHF